MRWCMLCGETISDSFVAVTWGQRVAIALALGHIPKHSNCAGAFACRACRNSMGQPLADACMRWSSPTPRCPNSQLRWPSAKPSFPTCALGFVHFVMITESVVLTQSWRSCWRWTEAHHQGQALRNAFFCCRCLLQSMSACRAGFNKYSPPPSPCSTPHLVMLLLRLCLRRVLISLILCVRCQATRQHHSRCLCGQQR